MVLNLTTGHVSPQFHVKFDPKFQTVREALGNLAPHSEWQHQRRQIAGEQTNIGCSSRDICGVSIF